MKLIRLVLGTILPPFIGALVLLVILLIEKRTAPDIPALAGALVCFLWLSYCIMILPSLGYSIIMELIGILMKKRMIPYLFISGTLGALAGTVGFYWMNQHDLSYVTTTGFITGILTGALLKRVHTIEANLYISTGSQR